MSIMSIKRYKYIMVTIYQNFHLKKYFTVMVYLIFSTFFTA